MVDAASDEGITPLIAACSKGHIKAAKLLLDADADANSNAKDKDKGQTNTLILTTIFLLTPHSILSCFYLI